MRGRKFRFTVIFCWLTGAILPWILAWLAADATGAWFASWWARLHAGSDPGIYLWAVCIMTGIVTCIAVSAIGFLITFVVDELLASRHSSGGN